MSNIVAVITARGQSKGIPGKNLRPLAGKPLIAWTIEAARASKLLNRVIVSTDDARIAGVAREYGAEVPFMRPAALAADNSSSADVMLHAISWIKEHVEAPCDYVMLLQPTSPFRTTNDIDTAIKLALSKQAVAVVSVVEVDRHPYLMKRILENGMMEDIFQTDIAYLRRQALPTCYSLNGAIYLNRPDVFRSEKVFWPKGTYAYVMTSEHSFEIDTFWDLHVAELLMRDYVAREIN